MMMNDTEIRQEMAMLEGYTAQSPESRPDLTPEQLNTYWYDSNKQLKQLPDYLNDYNACQQVLVKLSLEFTFQEKYPQSLNHIIYRDDSVFKWLASPKQICEAILTACDKWDKRVYQKYGKRDFTNAKPYSVFVVIDGVEIPCEVITAGKALNCVKFEYVDKRGSRYCICDGGPGSGEYKYIIKD